MSPTTTFLFGLLLLGFLIWYFFTDFSLRKRMIGLALTVLLVAFCLDALVRLGV